MTAKILILGATGQVGWELARTLMPLGRTICASRDAGQGPRADLGDLAALARLLDRESPDLIVNAAAYTAVDKAETEPELAERINAEAPGELGRWAAEHDRAVIHYSTDYVFDGTKDGAYVETDTPSPINVYGRTKLAGEHAMLASGADAVILRVSWVYGRRGNNFLRTMQRLMNEREHLRIVDDQVGAPTWSRAIAETSALVAQRLLALDGTEDAIDAVRASPHPTAGAVPGTADARAVSANRTRSELGGVYHLSPGGETSWYGFAGAIRDALGLDCELEPIPTREYPTPAARPANSRLDAGKLQRTFGLRLPGWEDLLRLCLTE